MANDRCVSIAPYFEVPDERMDEFKGLVARFVEASEKEEGCLYYGFLFDGNTATCREGYAGADGVLAHLSNVGELFAQAQEVGQLIRMEVHGPEEELARLREPLDGMGIDFYALEAGFRR
ncbi:putative quinol monooxygenase [Salinisphaera aquimarina]|uniref:Quinol monooxygenase n=1 Tax=Salinisphaera aquimarina TaxID=2094031 RepID=A0ABV7EUJ4_9GAMM